MKKIFALLIGCFCVAVLFGQSTERINFPLIIDGQELPNAWAGGLDIPQFSKVDLNDDGVQDLFIFDRMGEVSLTFINDNNSYIYAPEYIENFPRMRHFALLRDFNGDGIQDIFAHAKTSESADGMVVYQGKYTDGKIDFERYHFWEMINATGFDVISIPLTNGSPTNLYVPSTDIPDINDIDGDGDLDVLAFDVGGSYLVYYQNQSVEEGFGQDSLIFVKEDNCWGKFYESSMSEEVELSDDPNNCASGFNGGSADERHAGSTSTSIDLDNDGDKEVLIGDLINPHLFMLVNGEDAENAWITEQDNEFPSSDEPVVISDFVAAYILDLDFDGIDDMMATTNQDNSPNYDLAWFYKNTGTQAFPNFELQQKDFLVNEMIDLGSGTHPAIADIDGDGLQDLIVGTFGYALNAGVQDPRLFYFRNTGTVDQPAFELVDDNWLNFAQYGSATAAEPTWAFTPTFGDLDSDGDLDLLVGEYYGSLFFSENTAGPGEAMQFNNVIVEWQDLDVGLNSAPQIVDLNRDGLNDIVVGERNGNINFMRNIGTADNPVFHEEENEAPNINFTGAVDAALPGEGFGHSVPFFYDFNGEWVLYLGTRSQDILVFDNINPDDLTAPFNLVNPQLGDIHEGRRTRVVLADLTNSAELDMIIGNFRGGLAAFGTNISTSVSNVPGNSDLVLFPNPVQDLLQIQRPNAAQAEKYRIVNAVGQEVRHGVLLQEMNYVSVGDLVSGVYFIQTETGSGKFIKK